IIYMIGDGMGLAHLSMVAIEGGYEPTAFDRAHNVALISTYSANNRVTDSAAAGTALATGCKTDNGMLGVRSDGSPVESIMAEASRSGMATGVVVTSSVLHATPGAFYAHVASRGDEEQIARDLVASGLDVAIGGGRKVLFEAECGGATCAEALRSAGYTVVESLEEAAGVTDGRLVGLCAENHMPSMLGGRGDFLPKAVDKALEILSANAVSEGSGFMLMVEGSQIDFESHGNNTEGILAEMRDFEQAVAAAMDFADRTPGTLVVVCADHETSGMAVVSNNRDFTESESGIRYVYGTTSHSGAYVPVYLYGTGAECVNGLLDNTALAQRLGEMIGVR
ncbi:MAG: alkaline phosphatase, partial [Alistipes sp.]|nr:alkaline phosphatase [Alistipes sp.]